MFKITLNIDKKLLPDNAVYLAVSTILLHTHTHTHTQEFKYARAKYNKIFQTTTPALHFFYGEEAGRIFYNCGFTQFSFGTPPAQLDMPPAQLGMPPVQLGMPPVQLGMPPAQLGTPPVQFGMPPAQSKYPQTAQ
jgi:hypothetical protein